MMSKKYMPALVVVMALLLSISPSGSVLGQQQSSVDAQIDCSECHTCDVPTGRKPCLKICPRTAMVHQAANHDLSEAPDSMLLDDLVDEYQAVHFNHKLHAEMAEMGGDCATCHHYSPKGHIPPCVECHGGEENPNNLNQPTLKGAYHRQCLSCHREWSHDTKCIVCHIPTAGVALADQQPDSTDIIGISHPIITEPVKKVYHTPYEPGEVVTFQHKEHIDLFGFRCVDCHRHDVTHRMVRGYEGEAGAYAYPEAAAFGCRGCHLGEGEHNTRLEQPGRLGAPRPRHAGIPAVHFERLSCTVCHSGPVPRPGLTRVRTSRANRLGIYGIARWDTDFPFIREPVFVRDEEGRLAPNRVMWPSFWARIEEGGRAVPLSPELIQEQGPGILDAEEFVAQVLGLLALNPDLEGVPVLTAGERVFSPNPDGGLDVALWEDAAPAPGILWALRKEGTLVPLIPDFDPQAEAPDQDAELQVQLVLESLAALEHGPGQPAVIHKKTIYRMVGGYMEPAEYPAGGAEDLPGLFWWTEEQAAPLVSEFQLRTILALTGRPETLTEEQVVLVLARLNQGGDGHAFVAQGRIFQLDEEGALQVSGHQVAEPVTWPLSHPVRPSQQSLGYRGCTDCHLEGSEFFFSRVAAEGPLLTDQGEIRPASSFMGFDRPYQKLFGLSFRIRPLLKWVLAAAALVLAALLAIVLLRQLGQAAGLIEKRKG